jgi:hypothetical protein
MMQSTGILFTGKTKPLATTALDGTFALTLLAFDRIGAHQVEPWRLTFYGPEARAFWDTAQPALATPGQPLLVEAQRLRTFGGGRFGAPEVQATATRIALAPKAHEKAVQPG